MSHEGLHPKQTLSSRKGDKEPWKLAGSWGWKVIHKLPSEYLWFGKGPEGGLAEAVLAGKGPSLLPLRW